MSGVRVVERGRPRRRRSRRRGDERGLALVYFTLCLTVLMAASAFSVDVGAWYTRSQQLQRAADAAALAGVVFMPGDFATAQQTALDTLQANGIDPSANPNLTVSIARDPNSDRRLDVTVTDNKVAQYFSQAVMDGPVKQVRRGVGEYLAPIPLGSPENSLGNADNSCNSGTKTCVVPPNFVLAINGYCASTEDGDPVATKWDRNRGGGVYGGITYNYGQTHCPNPTPVSPEIANPSYSADGYKYEIDIPGTGLLSSNWNVDMYDAGFTVGPSAGADGSTAHDRSLSSDNNAVLTTYWKLMGPYASQFATTANTVASGTFDSSNAAFYKDAWRTIKTLQAGVNYAGIYRLQIYTKAGEANSWAMNGFAIRADTGTFNPCNTGTSGGCAQVFANGLMSIYGNDTSSSLNVYLAQIPQSDAAWYVGKTMEVTLFDPGEGMTSLNILQPDGNKQGGLSYSTDGVNWTAASGGAQDTVNLSGTVTPPSGVIGTSLYNDKTLMIKFALPSTTELTKGSGAGTNGWFRVKYNSATSTATDRTTWAVKVLASPVHLVNG